MTELFKLTGAAAVSLLAGTVVASATILDFTNNSTGASGAIDGIAWELTVFPDDLNQSDPGPNGASPTEDLAGQNDGIGIGDDEISFPRQYATLTFKEEVTIITTYWLDLFISEVVVDDLQVVTTALVDLPTVRQEKEIGYIGHGVGIGAVEDSFEAV